MIKELTWNSLLQYAEGCISDEAPSFDWLVDHANSARPAVWGLMDNKKVIIRLIENDTSQLQITFSPSGRISLKDGNVKLTSATTHIVADWLHTYWDTSPYAEPSILTLDTKSLLEKYRKSVWPGKRSEYKEHDNMEKRFIEIPFTRSEISFTNDSINSEWHSLQAIDRSKLSNWRHSDTNTLKPLPPIEWFNRIDISLGRMRYINNDPNLDWETIEENIGSLPLYALKP